MMGVGMMGGEQHHFHLHEISVSPDRWKGQHILVECEGRI
jgi:hypothetical protein